MDSDSQHETTDLANLCLRLRDGLQFDLQTIGGTTCYVVTDETSSAYYQIGIAEYAFVSMLDGKNSLQDAVQAAATRLGPDAFTVRDAIRTSHWLIQSRLAESVDPAGESSSLDVDQLFEQQQTRENQKRLAHANPLFIRVPLGNPQRLIERIMPVVGWIGSSAFFAVWMFVVGWALVRVWQSGELLAATQGVFAADSWLWLGVTFLGLKIIHEIAHGIFCHHFGGRVRETGLVLILFVPIPYVDVTSCWGFSSKWQRMAVSAAGMYVELFCAAVAAVVWSFSHDPVLKYHLFNVMLTGSLTTLFFNANFLMRFDGYYLLADWLEIPNLYQSGSEYLKTSAKRHLLGLNINSPQHSFGRGWIIRCYGVASMMWRVLICVSLSIMATTLAYGWGLLFAILGITVWVGLPLVGFVKLLLAGDGQVAPSWRRMALTFPAMAALGLATLVVPWPIQVSSPGLVKYEDAAHVRVDAGGFVTAVHVEPGQLVARGDLLVELEDSSLRFELLELESQRQRSLLRGRGLHRNRKIAAYQAEVASLHSIEKQIEDVQQKIESLTIRAPIAGCVLAEGLASLPGQYQRPGGELLQIVDEKKKEVVISVSQDDFDSFSVRDRKATFALKCSARRIAGTVKEIEPTASFQIETQLSSLGGGGLPVRQAESQPGDAGSAMELVHPRFRGVMSIDAAVSETLMAGSTGSVGIAQYSDSVAGHCYRQTRRWILGVYELARGSAAL